MEYVILFHLAFALNFVWEVWHSQLYTTCQAMGRWPLIRLLAWQSLKDALWITSAFVVSPNIYVFAAGLLLFSAVVELHAIKTKRWEYSHTMPIVFGVGVSPLFELAVTGVVAVLLLKLF